MIVPAYAQCLREQPVADPAFPVFICARNECYVKVSDRVFPLTLRHTYPHNPVDSGITVGIPVNICRQQKNIILFWFEEYGSLIEAYLHFSFPWEDVRFAVRFSI